QALVRTAERGPDLGAADRQLRQARLEVSAASASRASASRSAARALLAAIFGVLVAVVASAQDVQPLPPLTGRVIDRTATLSAAQQQALESKLANLEQQRGAQVVVLLVPTTKPEDIAAYAQRIADTWKIGRRD